VLEETSSSSCSTRRGRWTQVGGVDHAAGLQRPARRRGAVARRQHLGHQQGHRVLRISRKGGRDALERLGARRTRFRWSSGRAQQRPAVRRRHGAPDARDAGLAPGPGPRAQRESQIGRAAQPAQPATPSPPAWMTPPSPRRRVWTCSCGFSRRCRCCGSFSAERRWSAGTRTPGCPATPDRARAACSRTTTARRGPRIRHR
jgi:hypothetical protein